jgi:ABC-2 type transport system permease protein
MTIQQNYTAFKILFDREMTRIFRVWRQTILPPLITQSLYFAIFGGVIGSQLAQGRSSYTSFLVPGVIFMSAIMASYSNTAFTIFGLKFQRNIEEILISPTPTWVVLAAYISSAVIRGFITAGLVFAVGLMFGVVNIANPVMMLAVLGLSCSVFATLGILNALYSKTFDDVSTIPTFVLTPLTYLGGVFYPITQLTGVFRTISEYNPIVYLVSLFRGTFSGKFEYSWELSTAMIIFLNIVFISLVYILWKKGLGVKN